MFMIQRKRMTTESKPHKCPICHGSGHINIFPTCGDTVSHYNTQLGKCSACNGTGIVWSPSRALDYDPYLPIDVPAPHLPVVEPYFPLTVDLDKLSKTWPNDDGIDKLIESYKSFIKALEEHKKSQKVKKSKTKKKCKTT